MVYDAIHAPPEKIPDVSAGVDVAVMVAVLVVLFVLVMWGIAKLFKKRR